MQPRLIFLFLFINVLLPLHLLAADGNRLAYLDEFCDPYYVGRDFPKLITPQWAGEDGVEAVVVLAIDDMRDTAKYEAYLRPILNRLKQIDGRAPVSIMTCNVDPKDPQLQKWLREGLSIEVHTIDHPCPLLQGGDFAKAKSTYDRCVDLMNAIPNNKPVAFRMPCCDSMNTPSPRFWMEIFNESTAKNDFLTIDSSVFNIFTPDDPDLPRDLVLDKDGGQRFRKYLPFPSFVNTIENYPYPYIIGRACWEYPCAVPSDWEAQNLHKPFNPKTVEDMNAALDATVIKQGVFNLVFHPHGWIRSEQIIEVIDHAVEKHGKKVKFLTFSEAQQSLDNNLLDGRSLRDDEMGTFNDIKLVDVNNDGYMDVIDVKKRRTRVWLPQRRSWHETRFPADWKATGSGELSSDRFGVIREDGRACVIDTYITSDGSLELGAWNFIDTEWIHDPSLLNGITIESSVDLHTSGTLRLRDIDGDGRVEFIHGQPQGGGNVYQWSESEKKWSRLPFDLPVEIEILSCDTGFRFVDVNGDGRDDVLFSDQHGYSLHLFQSMEKGWLEVLAGNQGDRASIPPVIRRTDIPDNRASIESNGVWFHSGHLWVQNEDTNRLPDIVDRRSFDDLLKTHRRREAALKSQAVPIGAAKIDITPSFPIRMSGYGNRRTETDKVAQRLWAKALAIGDNEGDAPAVLITVENCGMTPAIRQRVLEKLNKKAAIPTERLCISVSHSHTAPVLSGWASYLFGEEIPEDHQKHIDQYTSVLIDKMVQVAVDALAARRPARLSWAQGKASFAANRRVLKDGNWAGFGVQADGPVDHSLPILVAKDAEDKLIAVVANYACHCTTLGGQFNEICGDWAGFAQQFIEEDNPGAVALITIGCGADANPNPRGDEIELCQKHGREISNEVLRLLKSSLEPIAPNLRCRLIEIDLPFDKLPSRDEWVKKSKQSGAAGYHARKFLQRIDAGEKIPATLSYPVASWTFGDDLAMVFLGGEVVVDYGIRLKEEFDAERLWITAYSNDVPCYIPSKRILREGGYEADRSMQYYARPARLTESTEDLVVDTVQKLLPAEFYSKDKQANFPPSKSPVESLAAIKTKPGMIVELVAAEPLVVDPVAFDWGADGRLWVVEMSDYPNGAAWNQEGDALGKPGGRIKVLTDTDADGRYDKASLFLDGISFPTGIKVWRNGVLVTAAPEIFYAEDSDGDGTADHRETLYRGFGEGNQQHRVNGLRWGLDNWLYVGNGDSGGTIKSLKTGEEVNVSGRDLRIRPDEGLIEPQSGQTQFGRCQDDHGNWFGGNNSNPMWHYVLDDRYLRRNPHFAPPDLRKQVSEQPGAAPVFPLSKTLARFNDFDRTDRFTSACSPIIYRDKLLGPGFYGNSFVCEPVHNLVHREVVAPDGLTFTSRRADDEQQSEFLASTDNWFRPVMVRTGPDGALWIADMYRFVIEHPKWIPRDWQRRLDLRAGHDKGRIYRVYVEDHPPRPMPQLDKLDAGGLVAAISSPNGWVRDLAQQMLIWRNDKTAVKPLEEIVASSDNPLARLHALCTLDGVRALRLEPVIHGIGQRQHPAVQRHAVRLSEPFLDQDVGDTRKLWGRYANNPFPRDEEATTVADLVWWNEPLSHPHHEFDELLALQLAYTLGETKNGRAGTDLRWLDFRRFSNHYLHAAIVSSAHADNVGQLLKGVLSNRRVPYDLAEQLLVTVMAIGDDQARARALSSVVKSDGGSYELWQLSAMNGVLDMLSRRMRMQLLSHEEIRASVEEMFQFARGIVEDEDDSVERRAAATRLLARGPTKRDDDLRLLGRLLVPTNPHVVQSAALESLGRREDIDVAEMILAPWKSYSPSVRNQTLDILLSRATLTTKLLDALESNRVTASHLGASRRDHLLRSKNDAIRQRAERVFVGATNPDRAKVVQEYVGALALTADTARGKAVFAKRCANCHRLGEVGHAVGPDLAALTDKSSNSLLTSILDPNRAVEEKFLGYVVVTDDGRQHSGMITSETSNAITLATAEGKQAVVLRNNLDELYSSGKSYMPEGLEKDCSPQQLADVIAYVRKTGPPRKQFPGNTPVVVTADDEGRIRLLATYCKIYGSRLVFEKKYSNLGWWASESDRAVWSFVVPKKGRFRVMLDYASDNSAAGDRFQLTVAGKTLDGVVEGTGTWDDYREKEIGQVELTAGAADLVFQAKGRIKSALIDLRGITLVPDQE